MTNFPLTLAAFVLLIAVASGLFVWVGSQGNAKAARRVALKRLVTPYVPPANSRPQDFDPKGRPW